MTHGQARKKATGNPFKTGIVNYMLWFQGWKVAKYVSAHDWANLFATEAVHDITVGHWPFLD